jgi:branched-chain amino acid transport system permease protein
VVGGFLVGLVSNISLLWLPTSFGDATIYATLLLFIMLRPTGLFGHHMLKRVA